MGRLNQGGKDNRGIDKGATSSTPPGQPIKPKYGDKKIVKAVNPKKGGK